MGILLTLSLVLAFVILNLDSIARSQINKALDRYLVAGGKLETIDIHLMEGRIALGGLTINSPPESGPDPLLDLGELEVDVDPFALFSGKVLVEHVTVNGLSLNIVRNEQGRLSPLELVSTASIKDEPETVEDEKESGLPWISTVHVKFIQVAGLSFRLNDRLMDKQWYAGLDLDLAITGLRLEDHAQFDISVDSIDLALSQIIVDQVPGFGTQKLFSLDHFTVVSGKSDMASTELVVEKVLLQGLSSSVTMRSDGLTNLQKLKGALFDSADENRPNKEAATAVADTPSLKSVLPTVRFEQILLENGSATYRDEAFADEPLVAVLNQIHMEATQLHMFTDDKSVDPASATLSFELEQPGDLPKAYFGTLAGVGPVGNGIPLVNTQVRLVGLKLETLGSLVPLETRTVLGVTGLDVGMAMALNENSINLNASILTDRNIKYEGITVRGFLDAPVVKNGLV